jgi:hypothetical protein
MRARICAVCELLPGYTVLTDFPPATVPPIGGSTALFSLTENQM